MSTAGHPVRGCGCSTRTEPPASSPPAAAIRWPCLCCSQHSGIVATLCVTALSRMENKMCQPSACLVMILRDLASQPWPCATREETQALLLSAFCPRCSCRLCRLPLPGRGNRAAAPAPSAAALGQRCGAAGRPEGAAPCSLPPALLSRAAEGQQLCAKSSLLMKPARALHFLFALATLHSRHFDGKLMTTMSSTMCWALPDPGARTGEVTVLMALAVLTLTQSWT